MKTVRFINNICRIRNSVQCRGGHCQNISIRNVGILQNGLFKFFLCQFAKRLHANIMVCRIKSVHHPLAVRAKPRIHSSDKGGKKYKQERHNKHSSISAFCTGKLAEDKTEINPASKRCWSVYLFCNTIRFTADCFHWRNASDLFCSDKNKSGNQHHNENICRDQHENWRTCWNTHPRCGNGGISDNAA